MGKKDVVISLPQGGGGSKDFYNDIMKHSPESKFLSNGFTAKGSNIVERTLGYGTKHSVSQNDVV